MVLSLESFDVVKFGHCTKIPIPAVSKILETMVANCVWWYVKSHIDDIEAPECKPNMLTWYLFEVATTPT